MGTDFFIFTRQVQGIWRGKKLHINLNLISKGQVKPMDIGYLPLYTSSKKYLLWGKRGVDVQLWQQRGASLQNEVRHQTCSVRQHQFTLVVKTLKIISKDCPFLLLASPSDGNIPLMHSRQKAFYSNHSVCCRGSKKEKGQVGLVSLITPVLGYTVWLLVAPTECSDKHGLWVPPAQWRTNVWSSKEFKEVWF